MEQSESYTPVVTPETYSAADMATVLRHVNELEAKVSAMRKAHETDRARIHDALNSLLPDDKKLSTVAGSVRVPAPSGGGSVGAKVRNLIAGL
jgi:hypothetical protein